MARLKALARRSEGRSHSAIIIYGQFECHVKARTAFRQNQHIALSPKEFELFRYFMENAGETVTRDMLLRDVWGMNFDPQTNVIDVHVSRLRSKIERGFETRRDEKGAVGFFHGTGHGLGLEVHEAPRVSVVSHKLKENTVVTVEPGLYYPGVGGCRFEDVVAVRKDGFELLSDYHYRWQIR